MSRPHRRLAAVLATLTPFLAVPTTAAAPAVAAPAVAATPAVADIAAEQAPADVTVRPDPSYQGQTFEGWGTSLVWFANITGGYPEPIRRQLAEMLFGAEGLNLNIARYNIGGGNAPDVRTDYMKLGATMEGFWKAPPGTTHTDTEWWNPDDPDHWNWDADANQRWWIDQIKGKVDRWEAFSNSPPYFQTVSGYVSGGFNSSADQIRADKVDEFATYLVEVTEHIEQAHGITFDAIEPLNEPNTPYWGTTLGADGQPIGGRQEGAHAGPALQDKVIRALQQALVGARTTATIAAMDETSPDIARTDWNGYTPEARAAIERLNVHTYGTNARTSVRDIAKGAGKPLWMSEVDGTWGTGNSFTSMEPGLGIAHRIVDDMRELEPSAWVLWQAIEDYGPQAAAGKNWGAIQVPFNCTASDTLQTCPVRANTKFDTIRNFTHFIRPGDRFIKVDDTNTAAAVSADGESADVVYVNDADATRTIDLDLSRFGHIAGDATVTPVVSDGSGGLVRRDAVRVSGGKARYTVPAKSVTTFVVSGVGGVAKDKALIQAGHTYRLEGVASGKVLTPSGDSTVIRTADPSSGAQLWRIEGLTTDLGNRDRYAVVNAATGDRLAVRDGRLVVGPDGPAAQWLLSTTGDGSYTLVNATTGRLVDVTGNATTDGAAVSTSGPNSGSNQRWAIRDHTISSIVPTRVLTSPGTAPTLPATVKASLWDGSTAPLPVVWTQLPDSTWRTSHTVVVQGTATTSLGKTIAVQATVVIDTIVSTSPARAKTYVNGVPELPATVAGTTQGGEVFDLPVTWEALPAFATTGVVTVAGSAGQDVPATVRVQVTEPSLVNAARDSGVVASATYTEPGYSAAGLINGNTGEKAWSNWRSGTKNPSDTLTFKLPRQRDLTAVTVHFYRDGTTASYAQSLHAEVRDPGTGGWVAASDEVTVQTDSRVVTVPLRTGAATSEVRVVLTARPSSWITVSEVEITAKAPGRSSDASLSSISIDGQLLAGFSPDVTSYAVNGGPAEVTAQTTDPYASLTTSQADRRTTITVGSEDGTQQRTYEITFTR